MKLQGPQETSQLVEVMEMAEIQQVLGAYSGCFSFLSVFGPQHMLSLAKGLTIMKSFFMRRLLLCEFLYHFLTPKNITCTGVL